MRMADIANILFSMPEELERCKLAFHSPQEKQYFLSYTKEKYFEIVENDFLSHLRELDIKLWLEGDR